MHLSIPSLQDPYNFDATDTPPLLPFARSSDTGELKGSGKKQTASMAGVLNTIRKEERYQASFSDSDGDEVINSTYTYTCTFCSFRRPPTPGRRL
jgi:hypothetical protein